MRRELRWSLLLLCLVTASPLCLGASVPSDEAKLIALLESNASAAQKDAACATLKLVGTARSVPALARLLPEPELSHSARYALESMPYSEASAALVAALPRTSGSLKAGVIHSLQVRRDTHAVPSLAAALADRDETVACAAAEALGEIGGREARAIVERSLRQDKPGGALRLALADALLKMAQALQDSGAKAEALSIYRRLTESQWPDFIRGGAWRGVFLTSGPRNLNRLIQALQGDDEVARTAALNVVPVIPTIGPLALAQALPKLQPPVQAAVLAGLAQRGDVSVARFIVPLAEARTAETRTAALAALGTLGDADQVRLLAEKAAATTGSEQAAARQALVQLNRGPITQELTSVMRSSSPRVQSEIARALGERRETAAVPALIELARAGDGTVTAAAFQALGSVAGPQHIRELVGLVQSAGSSASRAQAAEALNTVLQRCLAAGRLVDLEPLTDGVRNGSPAARAALLPVCSGITSEPTRTLLREAVQSPDTAIRAAGIAALSDSVDPLLLPDLTELAVRGADAQSRNLALAGIVRLWAQEEPAKVPHAQKLQSARALAACQLADDQWRRLLAGLAEIPDPEVIPMIEAQFGKAALKNEAARSLVRLAASPPLAEGARRALSRLDLATLDQGTRNAVLNALRQLEARLAYLTAWQVAGPYRESGKSFSELFDLPLGPEKGSQVEWKPAEFSTDPAKPHTVDLLKSFGGEQCVGYARTEVQAEAEADGVLEIGSDDGIKIWLNGALVHANNTARPLQPGQDKARVRLKPGRNELLVKLTQNNLGWEFCVKLVNPDGRLIEGVTNR